MRFASTRRALLAAALTTTACAGAWAQPAPYPNHPVRLVVAMPPGGTTDVVARLLAQRLSEVLGQGFVVDNRAGASGLIGTKEVVGSAADGYTLLLSSSQLSTFNALYPKAGFDPEADMEPLGLVATSPYMLVVHPSLPVHTVQELIAYARAHPGEISYAGSTPGSPPHLGWEVFKRATGTDMRFIPYKGTGALMPDLLSRRLQAAIDNVVVLTPQVRSGQLRAIAVTGSSRSALWPELPTVAESGVPGYQTIGWFGLYGPAKMPAEVTARLRSALVR